MRTAEVTHFPVAGHAASDGGCVKQAVQTCSIPI